MLSATAAVAGAPLPRSGECVHDRCVCVTVFRVIVAEGPREIVVLRTVVANEGAHYYGSTDLFRTSHAAAAAPPRCEFLPPPQSSQAPAPTYRLLMMQLPPNLTPCARVARDDPHVVLSPRLDQRPQQKLCCLAQRWRTCQSGTCLRVCDYLVRRRAPHTVIMLH